MKTKLSKELTDGAKIIRPRPISKPPVCHAFTTHTQAERRSRAEVATHARLKRREEEVSVESARKSREDLIPSPN